MPVERLSKIEEENEFTLNAMERSACIIIKQMLFCLSFRRQDEFPSMFHALHIHCTCFQSIQFPSIVC